MAGTERPVWARCDLIWQAGKGPARYRAARLGMAGRARRCGLRYRMARQVGRGLAGGKWNALETRD